MLQDFSALASGVYKHVTYNTSGMGNGQHFRPDIPVGSSWQHSFYGLRKILSSSVVRILWRSLDVRSPLANFIYVYICVYAYVHIIL